MACSSLEGELQAALGSCWAYVAISIARGTSAVCQNPDYDAELSRWEHCGFRRRHALGASEMVGFDVLDSALLGRGAPQGQGARL